MGGSCCGNEKTTTDIEADRLPREQFYKVESLIISKIEGIRF
jgi:hypothetical protein